MVPMSYILDRMHGLRKALIPQICISNVALRGLAAAWGTLIMVSVCLMKNFALKIEFLVITRRIIAWSS